MSYYNVLTIDEYCKSEGLSESGARKRVKNKSVKSAVINEELHILIPSNQNEIIKDLKHKITIKNKTISSLRDFKKNASSEAERIKELEEKIDNLHREHKTDIKEIYKENTNDLKDTMEKSIQQITMVEWKKKG